MCILLVGFGLRVWDIGLPSLWADEIMTEYRAQAPLWDSLENILKTIDQTPLFFMVLRIFPNGNEFLLRLPVALGGVFGVALAMFTVRRLYRDDGLALWVGVWLAVNPYHVWLSRTARHYSLIFIFSVLISYSFLALWQGRTTRRMWVLFTLSSLGGYITHYSLIALPFTQVIMLAIYFRERLAFIHRWVVAQTIAVLPMAVWFILMVLNATSREPQWGDHPGVRDLALTLRNLTTGVDGPLAWYAIPGLVVAAGGMLWIAVLRSRLPARDIPLTLYWAVLAFAPLLLVFVLSLTAVNAYIDRYFMALLPGGAVLIGYGWTKVARRVQPGAMWAALLAVLLTGVVTVGLSLHRTQLQREDWRGVAAYVEAHYEPDDFFVVDRAVTMTSLQRYLSLGGDLAVIQLSESDDPIPPDEKGARYWVIYRAPDEDIHRVGMLPTFDPLQPQHSVTSDWLSPRQQYIIEQHRFDGVTLLLLQLDDTLAQQSPASD